ncbi:MAG: amidohydrolase family protein [Alphaproteobacteria bacterium]
MIRTLCLGSLTTVLLLVQGAAAARGAPPIPPPAFEVHKSRAPLDRPVRGKAARYRGPIIDTHAHIFERRDRLNLSSVLEEMEQAGVRRLFVLPTPNEGRYDERDENAAARRRFVRIAGKRAGRLCGSGYFTTWMHDAYRSGYERAELDKRLIRLERDLITGGCLGIGEIGPHHFEKHPGQWVLDFPMNFVPMVRLAQLAARLGVWLDLHAEPVTPDGKSHEDRVFGGITHLFREAPGLKMILAHTAMTNATNARALLEAFPRLMMNIKIVVPGRKLAWDNLGPIVNQRKRLFEDWAQLMEAMPDRFLIGIDARFGSRRYDDDKYRRRVRRLRRILGSLDPKAAEMIAWRNAERLWPTGR